MSSITYERLSVGDSAEISRTINEEEVGTFARITGDLNPVHLDEEWARNTIFKKRIVLGILVTGLISNVLGNRLPGIGTIYVSQSLNFLAPVFFGDTITARVDVVEKREKRRVRLRTVCRNQRNETVIEGEAIVLPPREDTPSPRNAT
ncbi:MAG: MaoC family dehydratase [Pseudomonadota bacterium]